MTSTFIARNILLLMSFLFLAYVFFKPKQNAQLNWAMFFSSLWVALSLLLVNYLSVELGFWEFNQDEDLTIFIPYDLYFIWVVFWGVLLPFLLRGKYILIAALSLLYLDVLLMPLMEEYGLIVLEEKWLIGELLLILFVYLPAHFWSYLFLENKGLRWRSVLQFLSLAILYSIGLPFVVYVYFPSSISYTTEKLPCFFQLGFMVLLPALIAIVDLAGKGKGTPFPYDPTQKLVQTGAYAYIRNPIQWSLTFFFIPLAWFFHSYYLLIGIVVSVAYTIGVSEPQEKVSMHERFSEQWDSYKQNIPLWYFLWRPIYIPIATIYFKKNCNQCSQWRAWLEKRKPIQLVFKDAEVFDGNKLVQVTYQHNNGQLYTGVKAIAHTFEHINLAWASLGWFMRLPLISSLLQLIVDSMGLMDVNEKCELRE